jgi:hypothetical protein
MTFRDQLRSGLVAAADPLVPLPLDDAEVDEVQAEGWEPRDDFGVERALRFLDHLAREYGEVRARAEAWHAEITAWERLALARVQGPAERVSVALEVFALAQRRATGSKSFSYPSGVLETRKGRDKVTVVDEAALLVWARRECPAAVKVVESVLVSKLPEHAVVDGRMVLDGGEVVPGVSVTSGDLYVSASVKLTSARELPSGKS